jgi:hypothetical protein
MLRGIQISIFLLQNNNNRVSSTKYKKVNQTAVKYIAGKMDIFLRKFWSQFWFTVSGMDEGQGVVVLLKRC